MKRGAAREGYGGIFAGGVNATTLHYVFNDEVMKSGDLLLVDAGAEYNYFTGDITRTYPINGRFNEEQAEVYTGVLDVQKAIIEAVKPGLPFSELQEMATHMLTDVMLELGLLTGRKEDIIKAGDQKKYYPHGVSHFLGMDVHDLGMYKTKDNKPRLIEEGMVFTIEPGLYIPANDTKAAKEYRGIGVRIEDNILVTARGAEVLTSKAPKEIADLEKIVGSYQSS
jgi:Xaa-Pro aminopeptidase